MQVILEDNIDPDSMTYEVRANSFTLSLRKHLDNTILLSIQLI